MLTINDIHKEENIKKYHEGIYSDMLLEDVLSDKQKQIDLFTDVLGKIISKKMRKDGYYDNDDIFNPYKKIIEYIRLNISYELLSYTLINTDHYLNTSVREAIFKAYPYLELINEISLTPWQWYAEDKNKELTEKMFNILTNLPKFKDDRFVVDPICAANCMGFNNSPWLKKYKGGYYKDINVDTGEVTFKKYDSAYRNIYIDGKVGIVLFFENKPSITVSFAFDNSNNIYIHQIQAQLKDRGHYKLGDEWRKEVIDYVKNVFKNSNLYLVDGKDLSQMVSSMYVESKMSEETKKQIEKTYNELLLDNKSELIRKIGTGISRTSLGYRKI